MRVKRLFRSPSLSAETARRFLHTGANNPTRPANNSDRFRPSTVQFSALFAAKRGFLPQTPAINAPKCARMPRFALALPTFRPARPMKSPPLSARKFGMCTVPGPRGRPRERLFAPLAPDCVPPPSPIAEIPPAKPAAPPFAAVHRPKVSLFAPPRHSLAVRQTRLPSSAFPLRREGVYSPRGDQILKPCKQETAAHSRVNFREIRGPGYQPQNKKKRTLV